MLHLKETAYCTAAIASTRQISVKCDHEQARQALFHLQVAFNEVTLESQSSGASHSQAQLEIGSGDNAACE